MGGVGVLCWWLSHIAGHSLCSLPSRVRQPPSWQIFRQSGQKGAKVNFYLLGFVLPPRNRRQQRAKSKHIFESGCKAGAGCGSACLPLRVPTCAGLQASGPAGCWRLSSGGAFPAFPALLLWCCPEYGLFRILRGFLAGFGCWMYVCMFRCLAWIVGLLCA